MEIKKYDHSEFLSFDGRYDLKYWGRVKNEYLSVNKHEFENEIDAIVSFMKQNNLNKLEILEKNAFQEFTVDLTNLNRLTFLKELFISGGFFENHESLENLVQLEGLYLSINANNKKNVDLSKLENLVYLQIDNNINNITGFEKLLNLETLILTKYKPKTLDLSGFYLPKLNSLELVSAKIKNLSGLESCNNIKCFTLFRSPSLTNIDEMKKLKLLEYLTIDRCKNIESFDKLENNKNIWSLGIENSNKIENINFIKQLNNLRVAGFTGTSIESNDLEPLKNIPWVSVTNNPKYNYICKDFKLIPR